MVFVSFLVGIVGFIIVSLFLISIVFKYHYVSSVSEGKLIVEDYFVISRKIAFDQIIEFSYKKFGTGRGQSEECVFYYKNQRGQTKHAFLIHYQMTGNRNIIKLLDLLNDEVTIDRESFERLGIIYRDGKYMAVNK
jgi:hypothetical protein